MGFGKLVASALAIGVLAACKVEIIVPEGGRVISDSLTCRGGNTCTVDVTDTNFDETFRAIPAADRYTFTGWLRADRHFCGDWMGSCSLSTQLFEGNDAWMALLNDDEEVFYLMPKFEELSDNAAPGATPFSLDQDFVHQGELGGRKVSYDNDSLSGAPIDDVDYFVFVAPVAGSVSVTLEEWNSDYNLALYRAENRLYGADLNGSTPEIVQFNVTKGATYYIAVTALDETRGNYSLAVSFDPSVKGSAAQSPVTAATSTAAASGVYEVYYSNALGTCQISGAISLTGTRGELTVFADGTFAKGSEGSEESDDSLMYRMYANDMPHGTVIRNDSYRFPGFGDSPETILHSVISGQFSQNKIRGEISDRFVFLNDDGTKFDDCTLHGTLYGEKVADL
ncbi:MAG: hypothetical protein AAGF57_11535 [Pseudomonadota bacterium]